MHGWINVDDLDASNTLESLHSRGFVFPPGQQGMLFHSGNILKSNDPKDSTMLGASGSISSIAAAASSGKMTDSLEGNTYRFILCSIGVGKSVVLDDPHILPRPQLPQGYDSFFVAPSSNTFGDGKQKGARKTRGDRPSSALSNEYEHDYILLDPAQSLPLYLVQFTVSYSRAVSRIGVYGQEYDVDPDSQEVIQLTKKDLLGPMTPVIQQIYERYDFFDPILYVPVSVRDKMVGSHSTGEAAQHKLIGIGDAYDAALAESINPDPLVSQRQAEIRAHLAAVEGKVRDINRNAAEVEEQIYQMLQEALFQLQDQTKQRINILRAEEVELQRQLHHIDWVESFLEQQREVAQPVDFLYSWKCHVQLRGDVSKTPLTTPLVLNNVHANLALHGRISVVADGYEDDEDVAPTIAVVADNFDVNEQALEDGEAQGNIGGNQQNFSSDFQVDNEDNEPELLNEDDVEEKDDLNGPRSQNPSTARDPKRATGGLRKVDDLWNQALLEQASQPRGFSGSFSAFGNAPTSSSRAVDRSIASAAGGMNTSQGFANELASPPPPPPGKVAAIGGSAAAGAGAGVGVGAGASASADTSRLGPDTSVGSIRLDPMGRRKIPVSERCPPKFIANSLTNEATRRLKQKKLTELPDVSKLFEESKLIDDSVMNPGLIVKAEEEIRLAKEEAEKSAAEGKSPQRVPELPVFLKISEVHALIYALPIPAPESIETKLLYASWRDDERSVAKMISTMPKTRSTDPSGRVFEFMEDIPTIMLIKANGQVFGGFASQPWREDGQSFGNARCFLFSLTKDVKVPFHGRETLPVSPATLKYCIDNGIQPPKYSVLLSDLKKLQFGVEDLYIDSDFKNCSSSLEHSFGFGLVPGSAEATSFLSGSEKFDIEEIELWGITE